MKIEGQRDYIISLFKEKLFTADSGPVLSDVDVGGRNDDEVFINWVTDNEGNEESIAIPFESLDCVEYSNGSFHFIDEGGEDVEVVFFEAHPVTLPDAVLNP